jgi:pimeloyl-ACP methyl ester carboxylesterase
MANMNLLVPGTGGITLMNNLGEDLGYPVKMQIGVLSAGLLGLRANELIDLLSMDHRPGQLAPAKTSLKPGTSIRPGHVLQVAYNQVPSSFSHFLYDWRADIRYSAGQLLDFLRERRPVAGRWNLVGHSQGGLLIVAASKLLSDRAAFAELVASVVLVGTRWLAPSTQRTRCSRATRWVRVRQPRCRPSSEHGHRFTK